MIESPLKKAWTSLPVNATEHDLADRFVPYILNIFGFTEDEFIKQCPTGNSTDTVDVAARKNREDDNFFHTKKYPYLIIEVKNRVIDLTSNSSQYKSTVKQIKRYLHPTAINCQYVKWGIITNGNQIQLFRRHGKIVYPYTTNIELTIDNIDEKINILKEYVENTNRALSVALYNNKGGVGKTTTAINLAGILSIPPFNQKVLIVDFDPNQKDLTDLLGIKHESLGIFDCLKDKNKKIREAIYSYTIKTRNSKKYKLFDVIPADDRFSEQDKNQLLSIFGGRGKLRKVLDSLKNEYDYIVLDTPPNWQFFTQEAIAAADVIMMPSKHNSLASLKNAALAIQKFFPDLGKDRRHSYKELADPTPLPIFFNGEKISDAQRNQAKEAIWTIIKAAPKEFEYELRNYFFPKYTRARKDTTIYELSNHARIASAAFSKRPAVFSSKVANNYYTDLVKEYFL